MRNPTESRPCELRLSHLTRWLGVELEPGRLRQVLSELGYTLLSQEGEYLYLENAHIASFREIDLIEAIGRRLGYEEIRAQWPAMGFSVGRRDRLEEFKDKIRKILTSLCFNEACNESLLTTKETSLWPASLTIKENNNSASHFDKVIPRPSLLPGLFKNVAFNEQHQVAAIRLFEVGKIFQHDGPGVREQLSLAILLAGRAQLPLRGPEQFFDFQDIKGVVETLLFELGLRNFIFEALLHSTIWDGPSSLSIRAKEELLGHVGKPSEEALRQFGCATPALFVIELDLERLFTRLLTLSTPLWFELKPKIASGYASVRRALCIAVSASTTEGAVRWILEGEKRVENVFLSEHVFEGEGQKKIFKYEITLRDWNKTLSNEEVDEMLLRLKARCAQELNADVIFF